MCSNTRVKNSQHDITWQCQSAAWFPTWAGPPGAAAGRGSARATRPGIACRVCPAPATASPRQKPTPVKQICKQWQLT